MCILLLDLFLLAWRSPVASQPILDGGALVSMREGRCGCSNTPLAPGENPLERILRSRP